MNVKLKDRIITPSSEEAPIKLTENLFKYSFKL